VKTSMRTVVAISLFLGSATWAEDLKIVLAKNGQEIVLKDSGKLSATNSTPLAEGQGIELTCEAPLACSGISASLTNKQGTVLANLGAETTSATSVRFALPKNLTEGTAVRLSHDGKAVATLAVHRGGSAVKGGEESPEPTSPTLQELLASCPPPEHQPDQAYSRDGNLAHFWTTPFGAVVGRPSESIDEDDSVLVTVRADARLAPILLRRTTAIREPRLSIVGEGLQVPDLARHAKVIREADCRDYTMRLDDFAPGRGEIEISNWSGDKKVTLGAFEFVVNRLYSGMFSLGAVSTPVQNRTFTLVSKDGKAVIAAGEQGDRDLRYVVFYTPFMWGKRDLEKRSEPWYHRLNLTFGLGTKNVADNAFVGASFDYKGVVLTGGVHVARVTVLSEASGLEVGDAFAGAADKIPLAKDVQSDLFLGISIDLRAAIALQDPRIESLERLPRQRRGNQLRSRRPPIVTGCSAAAPAR